MWVLRHMHRRGALVVGFVAGGTTLLLVYVLMSSGPSAPTRSFSAASAMDGHSLAQVVNSDHLERVSLSCAKNDGGQAAQTVCGARGSMYASLVAMHTPRAELIYMLVHTTSREIVDGVPVPEAALLHGHYGVPIRLAKQLAPQIDRIYQHATP